MTFTPPSLGVFTATLVVTGPNGTQDVPAARVSSHGYHLVAVGRRASSASVTPPSTAPAAGMRLNQPVVGMAPHP